MATRCEDDKLIDDGYEHILRRYGEQMQNNPTEVERLLRVMWAARAVERIGDMLRILANT